MQNVIIGTAGHIDHGKTTLIKALTGRDTDTLREEKERGITINLGFTYFDLPSKRRAGIVDVPGHEKFIKNMLAGVSGIDIFLLVIAADEGIMPQTREHLNILKLLDIKKGIVVLTKIDLVDKEWLQFVSDDVKEFLKDTPFKGAPIIPVSSITKEGIDMLVNTIDNLTKEINERDILTDFRLPVDRSFTVPGFGTVVTGTLISGSITVGEECEIYTKGLRGKVRNLQVHEKDVKTAFAGQRVAINISGVKKDDVERGDVVAKIGSLESSMMIDCRLNYLEDAPKKLKNRDRIKLYHGTKEIIGRVILLEKDELAPGDTALVQFRLEEPIASRRGDKFIIRTYSPMITIGGGTILEPNAKKHKIGDSRVIEELLIKEKGTAYELVEKIIEKHSQSFPNIDEIRKLAGRGIENLEQIIEGLCIDKRVHLIDIGTEKIYVHFSYIKSLKEDAKQILNEYHIKNPLNYGMNKEEFKNKLFEQEKRTKLIDMLFNLLREDTIDLNTKYVKLKGFEIKLNKRQTEIKEKILNELKNANLMPPKIDTILDIFGREKETAKAILNLLIEDEVLVKIENEYYIMKDNIDYVKQWIADYIEKKGEISTSTFRDELKLNRKYAVMILEYLDSIKFTKRIEDKRVLYR
ncbi:MULTISPECIES: selenocysteine-specific translation elongation factor [Caloramator]|uniref:Selenocysteine-specific elongation factor n=1 Tax=Caloramator proteoclasticus DSM 10124 TaxID=1121262 RepID=A0A1M4TK39_9CLOT|nr:MULTISPECIES: selenocysteine-specific translation elongation factor [Caloramator]SHE44831.1 selenocysteine-specific elongation factor [Caloramator proteoclasticus DSM 10124]